MPYDPERDVYFWGKSDWARDGSDYDPNFKSPKLSDAVRVLERHFSDDTTFSVIIVGKLYRGQTKISGVSFNTDLLSLKVVTNPLRAFKGASRGHGGGGKTTTEDKIRILGKLTETPDHVLYIGFHPLD